MKGRCIHNVGNFVVLEKELRIKLRDTKKQSREIVNMFNGKICLG